MRKADSKRLNIEDDEDYLLKETENEDDHFSKEQWLDLGLDERLFDKIINNN